jgi:hypothetical protein
MLHEPHAPGSGRRSSTLILIALLLLGGISFGLHLNPENPGRSFMMPVGTPPNAIVFATRMIPQRQMLRIGLILNLTFVVALTILAQILF